MTRAFRAVAGTCVLLASLGAGDAIAAPFTLNFTGTIAFVREFSGNVLVPVAQQEFATPFQVGQAMNGAVTYDTGLADLDSSSAGRYLGADVAVHVPAVGLSIARAGSGVELRLFDDPPNADDQFNVFPDGVDAFSNSVGLPSPTGFWVGLFGLPTMLVSDQLPAAPLAWNFGNLSMTFTARDGSQRQVLLGFEPRPVPEPASLFLIGCGLVGCARVRSRQRR